MKDLSSKSSRQIGQCCSEVLAPEAGSTAESAVAGDLVSIKFAEQRIKATP